jgi:hypothetical protein
MFEIVLSLPFQLEATPENPMPIPTCFYKAVQIYALPFIGVHMFIRLYDEDEEVTHRKVVDGVFWHESEDRYHVRLQTHISLSENRSDEELMLRKAGWSKEIPPPMWF